MIFLLQLESINPRYDIEVESVNNFFAEYPISVYEKAAYMMGKVTTNKTALQMAATHFELTKPEEQFKTPMRATKALPFCLLP